jgi:hypothetical protein
MIPWDPHVLCLEYPMWGPFECVLRLRFSVKAVLFWIGEAIFTQSALATLYREHSHLASYILLFGDLILIYSNYGSQLLM